MSWLSPFFIVFVKNASKGVPQLEKVTKWQGVPTEWRVKVKGEK
jgi:hypothetical protein